MSDLLRELFDELAMFPGREEEMRKIYRWSIQPTMYYRPQLFSHSKKIAWMGVEIAPVVGKTLGDSFDLKKMLALGLVHDDAELITGDYQAGNKALMTKEQLAAIETGERAAIEKLAARFPKTIGGYPYRELLLDILDLTTAEAQVAKYLDLIDGYGEGLHEIYAGNVAFTRHVTNGFGIVPLFSDLNVGRRVKMMEHYPALAKLKDSHTLFELAPGLDWPTVVQTRSPHTLESLQEKVGYSQYDLWKQLILNSGDSEEIKNLYTQREF